MNTMLCDDDNEIMMCEFEAAEALAGLASKSTMHGGALSSGQRGKSEAEKQAQRQRRVIANRESARKTIYRRQAIYADLIRKEAELSVENEILKKEKERAVKQYDYSKTINEYLKAKVAKMAETEEESIKSVQIPISTLIFPYNHPSIVPFLWPAIGIQGSSQSHIAISTQFPIPMRDNILCSFQDQEHAKRINKQGTSLFTLPSPWSFPFLADRSPVGPNGCSNRSSSEIPTHSDQNCQLTSSQKTKSETCNSAEIMPVDKLTHKRMSCTKSITDTAGVKAVPSAARSATKDVSFKSQKPVVFYSRSENANAAAEARKRRRELMKLSIFTSINKREEGIYGIKEKPSSVDNADQHSRCRQGFH